MESAFCIIWTLSQACFRVGIDCSAATDDDWQVKLTWKAPACWPVQFSAARWKSSQTGRRTAGWAGSGAPGSSSWFGASPARWQGARADCGSTMDPRLRCTHTHSTQKHQSTHTSYPQILSELLKRHHLLRCRWGVNDAASGLDFILQVRGVKQSAASGWFASRSQMSTCHSSRFFLFFYTSCFSRSCSAGQQSVVGSNLQCGKAAVSLDFLSLQSEPEEESDESCKVTIEEKTHQYSAKKNPKQINEKPKTIITYQNIVSCRISFEAQATVHCFSLVSLWIDIGTLAIGFWLLIVPKSKININREPAFS